MLSHTDARFSGVGFSKIEIVFWAIRREDEFVLVYRATVNHYHRCVRKRSRCWCKQPTVNIPAKQLVGPLRVGIAAYAGLNFLYGKRRTQKRIGEVLIIVKGHVIDKFVAKAGAVL